MQHINNKNIALVPSYTISYTLYNSYTHENSTMIYIYTTKLIVRFKKQLENDLVYIIIGSFLVEFITTS